MSKVTQALFYILVFVQPGKSLCNMLSNSATAIATSRVDHASGNLSAEQKGRLQSVWPQMPLEKAAPPKRAKGCCWRMTLHSVGTRQRAEEEAGGACASCPA